MLDYDHLVNLSKGKVRPIRSRVIKGGYSYEGKLPPNQTLQEGYRPKGVHLGRIDLGVQEKEFVEVSYIPEGYGLGHIESIGDKEARFAREIEEMKASVDESNQQAYKEGYNKGLKEGRQQGQNQVAVELDKIGELLKATVNSTKDYFEDVEARMVEFSMMIARKVVGDAAENHREIAIELAKEAIRQAADKTQLTILVNKIDYETLKSARADFLSISEGVKEVNIEISDNVKPGGIILETVGGSIDATISTMLDEIHKSLLPQYDKPEEDE